jgi:hypothetical protein
MLMTRIGAPLTLVDGSLCHLYHFEPGARHIWLLPLCELTEAFVLAVQPDQVSLP